MGEPAVELDKIKYVVNGETRWYTIDELREHIVDKHRSVDINLSEESVEKKLNRVLERLEKYDGDPFGHLKNTKPQLYEIAHEMDAHDSMFIIR